MHPITLTRHSATFGDVTYNISFDAHHKVWKARHGDDAPLTASSLSALLALLGIQIADGMGWDR